MRLLQVRAGLLVYQVKQKDRAFRWSAQDLAADEVQAEYSKRNVTDVAEIRIE